MWPVLKKHLQHLTIMQVGHMRANWKEWSWSKMFLKSLLDVISYLEVCRILDGMNRRMGLVGLRALARCEALLEESRRKCCSTRQRTASHSTTAFELAFMVGLGFLSSFRLSKFHECNPAMSNPAMHVWSKLKGNCFTFVLCTIWSACLTMMLGLSSFRYPLKRVATKKTRARDRERHKPWKVKVCYSPTCFEEMWRILH